MRAETEHGLSRHHPRERSGHCRNSLPRRYIKPRNIERNGRKVAIIGAGPAGLAAANQLNGKGYTVTVFDKNEAPGGLLRYGIPNFKLHKPIIDRRIRVMEEEGIHFKMNNDVDVRQLPEV